MSAPEATELVDLVADAGVRSVRCVFPDANGLTRGKSIDAAAIGAAVEQGIGAPGSLLHKDTGNTYAIPLWKPSGDEVLDALLGARSMMLHPDASTFVQLPWAPATGWVLCDLALDDGTPIPHSTRRIARRALDELEAAGYRYRAGLELELTLFDRSDDGRLEPVHPGWDLLGEATLDRLELLVAPIVEALAAIGHRPRTVEAELGPGQVELTFEPASGLDVADGAVLIRNTIRSVARRNGLHATFMSRPALPGVTAFPSGWHLHQSLVAVGDGTPAFVPTESGELLSTIGRSAVAGLLANAAGACLLTTPTVTGYKRYRPEAVAPDRITWSREHRGAMLRIVGEPATGTTRIENRAGDPAANPYLFATSQIVSMGDGIRRGVEPPPPSESPYDDGSPLLPRTLGDAIEAFGAAPLWAEALGADVARYLARLRASDWARFCAAVTDWEQAEYFDRF